MTISVRSRVKIAERDAKRALSQIDTDFAASPTGAHIDASKSAGSLIALAASGPVVVDPVPVIRAIKKKTAARLTKARQPMDEGEQFAAWLSDAADFIAGKSLTLAVPPAGIPPHVVSNVEAVKIFARAGLVSADEVAAKLNRAARDAMDDLAAGQTNFKRFFSAAPVATMRKGADYAEACGRASMAEGMRKTYEVRSARHNRYYQQLKKMRAAR